MLPEDLFKPRPTQKFDVRRAKRIIHTQGALNILLLIGIAGVIFWTRIDSAKTAHRILTETQNAPVAFTMSIKAFGDDRELNTIDAVRTPLVTIYGKISDYDTLRGALKGFSVSVGGTTVNPNQRSGEFSGKVALRSGTNDIVIVVSWDDVEHYRGSYSITYAETTSDASSTPAINSDHRIFYDP